MEISYEKERDEYMNMDLKRKVKDRLLIWKYS